MFGMRKQAVVKEMSPVPLPPEDLAPTDAQIEAMVRRVATTGAFNVIRDGKSLVDNRIAFEMLYIQFLAFVRYEKDAHACVRDCFNSGGIVSETLTNLMIKSFQELPEALTPCYLNINPVWWEYVHTMLIASGITATKN